ncbi:MAG: zeta toxin family protein [Burkholderiales bacterium]|nr:zeta toxin family protein [Burkholderiales bacterium]
MTSHAAEGPWNPGLQSQIPEALLPLATIHRAEHVHTALREARELADLTGLPMEELVAFRAERLVLHELLARVTADFTVEDGQKTEDLGINFRRMTEAILSRHIVPELPRIAEEHEALRLRLRAAAEAALDRALGPQAAPAAAQRPGLIARLFGQAKATPAAAEADAESGDMRCVRQWERESETLRTSDPLQAAACAALGRVADAMLTRHGRLWRDTALIAKVATDLAANDYGSEEIGRRIEPLIERAAAAEGFRRLPVQAHPVVMNTKGASAAGKSTLRPLQRALAARLGVSWQDFALISPDIFRKFLLDYSTLGEAYKYAGSFTGHELQVVDRKLDRVMAHKAARGAMSHLLIDRFRFDTFAPASDVAGSNLLTRFGEIVYLFFMITPPHATVERAWHRGLEVGRYKAVDDLLAHNIEAYTGMPEVFFTWALAADKKVHYEFLDNSVALGETPRSIAFGWNGELNVLDVGGLINIERYRKINVEAGEADAVYPGSDDMAAARNTQFLEQCVRRLPRVNFADRDSGRIWLRIAQGRVLWQDTAALALALRDPATRAGIAAIAPQVLEAHASTTTAATPETLTADERTHTLGAWRQSATQP